MFDSIQQVLRILVLNIPSLVTFVVGLVIVLNLPASTPRRPAIAGLLVLLGSRLMDALVMALLPLIVLRSLDVENYERYGSLMFASRMVFNLLEVLGYGLLLTALARALRQLPPTR